MDWVLFVLTVVSLVAAAGFAVVAWRLLREERSRSAARVAALSAVLDGPVPPAGAGVNTGPYTDAGDAGPSPTMFSAERGEKVKGFPLIRVAVVGVMATIIVVAAAMGGRERPAAAATPAAAHEGAPLELMSMRHAREGTTMTVTGLVRNPAAGVEARRVAAIVFAFDRAGSFLGSGRAPLDFVVLEPGGESPFVVTIPNVAGVARYRVSFRTDDGVVRHVDRRADQLKLAQQ